MEYMCDWFKTTSQRYTWRSNTLSWSCWDLKLTAPCETTNMAIHLRKTRMVPFVVDLSIVIVGKWVISAEIYLFGEYVLAAAWCARYSVYCLYYITLKYLSVRGELSNLTNSWAIVWREIWPNLGRTHTQGNTHTPICTQKYIYPVLLCNLSQTWVR